MDYKWENYFDIESEYWKKVQEIYKENDHYPKIVVKNRNLHHKFPRSFSKKDGIEIDNDKDNLVSLSLASHFLVHYYLWKCCKKGYRRLMALAFQYMRKKAIKYASDETIEALAKDYENIMQDASEYVSEVNKGKHLSEETKRKISKARNGMKFSEETKHKISINVSNEMKDTKQKEKHIKGLRDWHKEIKGTKWWNNGVTNKMSKECPGDGWKLGRIPFDNHKGKHWKLIDGKRVYY